MTDKRQHLIEAAFSLFYRHGIHAVGINQILQNAEVAKKTLYKHFESKEKLVEAVLDYRDQRFVDWMTKRIEHEPRGKTALLVMFDALDDWINNRVEVLANFNGCFFINTCAEYGDSEMIPHRLCNAHKKRIRMLISEQVQVMNVNGAELLIDMLSLLKEGAIVTAQVQGDKQAAVTAKKMATELINNRESV
jgi:AcrR family transcriptional regulator